MTHSAIDLSSLHIDYKSGSFCRCSEVSLKCALLDSKVLKLEDMVFNVECRFSKSCFSLTAEERSFLRLSIFF